MSNKRAKGLSKQFLNQLLKYLSDDLYRTSNRRLSNYTPIAKKVLYIKEMAKLYYRSLYRRGYPRNYLSMLHPHQLVLYSKGTPKIQINIKLKSLTSASSYMIYLNLFSKSLFSSNKKPC